MVDDGTPPVAHFLALHGHTGLLERDTRERVEVLFKSGSQADAPNLLACTPTLEMGIDVGDLSSTMLCSVREPFNPADYEDDDEMTAEDIEMARKDDIRDAARDLLLVEQAREWLLVEM